MKQPEMNEIIYMIERSKQGDLQAVEKLTETIQDQVYFHCRKLLKRKEDAEDATQEILIVVISSLAGLQDPNAFWGWVNAITVNQCRKFLRSAREWQMPEDEDGGILLDDLEDLDEQIVPDKALDNEETKRMMMELVDALPPEQRLCTLCYYYDEMSVKQIAILTETAEGTVKSRLNYARRAIKEGVERYEKQGVKLYGASPLSLLLYFLRRDAEIGMDPQTAQAMRRRVLEARAASTAASASGTAAAGAAVSTAAGAAAHTAGGLSMKVIAGILAGVIALGGATVGVSKVLGRNGAAASDTIDGTALIQTAWPEDGVALPEDMEPPEALGAELVDQAILQSLAYTGEQFSMSVEQAVAFAQVLEEQAAAAQSASYPTFCQAALFDAGDGIPAMFLVSGNDMQYGLYEDDPLRYEGYMPSHSAVYQWDGEQAVLAMDTSEARNVILTDQGLLVGPYSTYLNDGTCSYTELYSLSDGCVSSEPVHIYELFAVETWLSEEKPSAETAKAMAAQGGKMGDDYDYSTLAGQWEFVEPGTDPYWGIAALDGTFLAPGAAAESGQALTYDTVTWLLGQGVTGRTDASWTWQGSWMDAAEMTAVLRSARAG